MATDLRIFGEQVEKIKRAQMRKATNGNAKAEMKRSCGFRIFAKLRLDLLYRPGKLTEPQFSLHKFLRRAYNQ